MPRSLHVRPVFWLRALAAVAPMIAVACYPQQVVTETDGASDVVSNADGTNGADARPTDGLLDVAPDVSNADGHLMDSAPDVRDASNVSDVARDVALDASDAALDITDVPLVCADGTAACDVGCPNLQTDPLNCGTCGHACPTEDGGVTTCASGVCVLACAPNYHMCSGGCVSDMAATSCGSTSCSPCPGGAFAACNGGTCGCQAGFTLCGVTCTNTATDSQNCNGCGNVCHNGTNCGGGVCTFASDGSEGAFTPGASTTLPSGVHNFTTITIPAGVQVTASDSSGPLDLRATGPVIIDGIVNASGGPGGNESGVNGAAGGLTGIPTPGGSSACGMSGAGGGTGGAGASGVASGIDCATPGGNHGGGAGGGMNSGGAGGGGYAGGGGGGSLSTGGSGGFTGSNTPGSGGTVLANSASSGGGGGSAPGAYAGNPGTTSPNDMMGGGPGGGGGGGSIGAAAAADLPMTTTFYAGSGGGGAGGTAFTCTQGGGGGGGGGGALRISSLVSISVTGTGQVLANGGPGGAGQPNNQCSAGGSGSGGAIWITAPTIAIAGTVSAAGGAAVGSAPPRGIPGGAGGLGRIRLSVGSGPNCVLGGTFSPLLANGCTPSSASGSAGFTYVATYPN